MSKYSFERIDSSRFETMVQALLEGLFRIQGSLVQFGPGKDGAREATWTQQPSHPTYMRPKTEDSDVPKEWVFQVKYHDIGRRGWTGARSDICGDIDGELRKLIGYEVPCHKYILATNVPFSGVRHVGTRDQVNEKITGWKEQIPEIEVWDAADLSRMLDANQSVRSAYLECILPGDVLYAVYTRVVQEKERLVGATRAYLHSLLRTEREAKAEEAGDEDSLKLERIFIDLDMKLIPKTLPPEGRSALFSHAPYDEGGKQHLPPLTRIPASFALLRAEYRAVLLKGGPGVGKSTITQFLALYHAARILGIGLADKLSQRLRLTGGLRPEELDKHCRMRFPVRIELRRYAQWATRSKSQDSDTYMARYIAEQINSSASSSLSMDDIFDIARENPFLLILDGLDEVPLVDSREMIFRELAIFLDRCEGESCDIQMILSSRPQGYQDEFSRYRPIEWHVSDLSIENFRKYSQDWLEIRIPSRSERTDALARINEGMKSHSVRQLALSLLQATVMLTIARQKKPIPHARNHLYQKYVDVIFLREELKETVRSHSEELLRLHEMVGFKLMLKMESSDGARTLTSGEFRKCVHAIIEDYGASELGGKSIGGVVNDIVEQAKNRLCFLAGKGDEQKDIDFVIQSFREYFAAAYLSHHESLESDKVYESLKDRFRAWGNVLQFYAGFQNRNQQTCWILDATVNLGGVDDTLRTVQRRRTLLRLLPEFSRPKNRFIQAAFAGILDTETRWAWGDTEEVARYLLAFSPREALKLLKKELYPLHLSDEHVLFIELDLMAKMVQNEEEVECLVGELSRLVDSGGLARNVAINVGIENNLPLDLSNCSLDEVALAYPSSSRKNVDGVGFSNSQKLDILIMTFPGLRFSDWNDLDSIRKGIFPTNTHYVQGLLIYIPAFLCERHNIDEVLGLIGGYSGSMVSGYLTALFSSLEATGDPERFQNAIREERLLEGRLPLHAQTRWQLGPGPSDFSTQDSWREALLVGFEELSSKWISKLSTEDGSWLTLFFHPNFWGELHSLIDPKKLSFLLEEVAPFVSNRSPKKVIPFGFFRRGLAFNVDMLEFIKAVVNTINAGGADYVSFGHSLNFGSLQGYDRASVEKVLEAACQVKLPEEWALLVITLCSRVSGLDATKALRFWTEQEIKGMWLWHPWIESDPDEKLLSDVLRNNTPGAIRMATFLLVGSGLRDSSVSTAIFRETGEKLCGLIRRSAESRKRDVELLLRLKQYAYAAEASIWSNSEILSEIAQDARLRRLTEERIRDLSKVRDAQEQKIVRAELTKIIKNPNAYDSGLRLAAADSLLALQESCVGPFREEDCCVSTVVDELERKEALR